MCMQFPASRFLTIRFISPACSPAHPGPCPYRRIASLREAFRRTPRWLGFNVELKYPTLLEVAAMRAQFYSRNHFVDAVLKVGWVGGLGGLGWAGVG